MLVKTGEKVEVLPEIFIAPIKAEDVKNIPHESDVTDSKVGDMWFVSTESKKEALESIADDSISDFDLFLIVYNGDRADGTRDLNFRKLLVTKE